MLGSSLALCSFLLLLIRPIRESKDTYEGVNCTVVIDELYFSLLQKVKAPVIGQKDHTMSGFLQ